MPEPLITVGSIVRFAVPSSQTVARRYRVEAIADAAYYDGTPANSAKAVLAPVDPAVGWVHNGRASFMPTGDPLIVATITDLVTVEVKP